MILRSEMQCVLKATFRKMKALAYAVFENYTSLIPAEPTEVKNYCLAKALLYLTEHFKEDLTRASVAAAIGYSESHISHSIEILPNMNFRRLLNSLRVEYAKKLLVSTDDGILKIALECGFHNDRSYSRAFLDIEGISPGEYRQRYRVS